MESTGDDAQTFDQLTYPTMVMVTAVLALVGLGLFQFLSRAQSTSAADHPKDVSAKT